MTTASSEKIYDGDDGSDKCALGDMSSHSSIDSTGFEDPKVHDAIQSAALAQVSLSPEVLDFWNTVKAEELILVALKDLLTKDTHTSRLENPSAAAAMDQAIATRTEFTTAIETHGSQNLQDMWFDLEDQYHDEFICHAFLPEELGGFSWKQDGEASDA